MARVRMWEHGHSFEEIDKLSVDDASDIIGYWSGKADGEGELRKSQQRLNRG